MHIPSTLAKNALGPLTDPGLLTPLSPTYIESDKVPQEAQVIEIPNIVGKV